MHLEVVDLPRRDPVAVGEEVADLPFRAAHPVDTPGGDEDRVHPLEAVPHQPLAGRRIGHEEDVVLVVADDVCPLLLEDPDDAEGNVADADDLLKRVGRLEQPRRDRRAENADLLRPRHVALAKKAPPADLPAPHRRIVDPDPEHLLRAPVGAGMDRLAGSGHQRRDGKHALALRGDRIDIPLGEGLERPLAHAPAFAGARDDDDHVRADRRKLPADHLGSALADRDERRHRSDADDDSEHGQQGAEPVLLERAEGELQCDHHPSGLEPDSVGPRSIVLGSDPDHEPLSRLDIPGDDLGGAVVADA